MISIDEDVTKRRVSSSRPRGKALTINAASDAQLLTQIARDGDRGAFEELYQRYADPGFSIAFRITRNSDRAEEALQEGLFRVWRSASSFREDGNAFGWIIKIIAREAMMLTRKEIQISRKTAAMKSESVFENEKSEILVEESECNTALRQNVGRLSLLERRLVAMYYGGGLSQNEIAKTLQIPQRTVSYQINNALQQLRAGMAKAGFTSLTLISVEEALSTLTCSGYSPPASTLNAILQRIETHPNASESVPITKAPKSSSQTLLLLSASIALVAVALGFKASQDPSNPTTAEPIETRTTSQDPSDAIPKPFRKKWTFEKDDLNDWTTHWAPVKWMPPNRKHGGRYTPEAGQFALLQLSQPLAPRPYRVQVIGNHMLGKEKNSNVGTYLSTIDKIPGGLLWTQTLTPPNRTAAINVEYFFFDNYYVLRDFNSKLIISIRKYDKPYPGDRFGIALKNVALDEVEITSLRRDELPKEFNDMPTVIRKLKSSPTRATERRISQNPNKIISKR